MNEYQYNAIKCGIPEHMIGGVVRYLEDGVPPGSFLSAVINNDLKEAFSQADDINRYCIYNYVQFLYSYAPSASWGYQGAVDNWIKNLKQSKK